MTRSGQHRRDLAIPTTVRRWRAAFCMSHILLLCLLLGAGQLLAQTLDNRSVSHDVVSQMDPNGHLASRGSLGIRRVWFASVLQPPALQDLRFFQSWWARAIAIVLIALSLAILIRMRLRQRLQHVKGSMGIVLEERNRIAQECH